MRRMYASPAAKIAVRILVLGTCVDSFGTSAIQTRSCAGSKPSSAALDKLS
jgi:hypothetical protein